MKARLRFYRHPRQQDFHRWRKGAIIGAGALGLTALVPLPATAVPTEYPELTTPTQMAAPAEVVYTSALDPSARSQSLNLGWKFIHGDQPGAEAKEYVDASWQTLDLPHDYSIHQDFSQSGEAESGFLLGGIGWYRKNLPLSEDFKDKQINVNFDGIYMDATIFVNGHKVANHPYGYTPFSVDITKYVKAGETNVLAVRVNHQTPSSRWYSGSGIYRNVDLVVTNPVHIAHDGVKVVAPTPKAGTMNLDVSAELANDTGKPTTVKVSHKLTSLDGITEYGKSHEQEVNIEPNSATSNNAAFAVDNVKLWSLKDPQRYLLTTTVTDAEGETIDTTTVKTGFRTTTFDANEGFSLNGEKMKLKGVAMHHDQGALGARAYRAAIARQIDILKEMGANAIRVTHNPAARDLIDLADEKGMLIIEEFFDGFQHPKNGNYNDYARFFEQLVRKHADDNPGLENVAQDSTWARFDLEATVRRDINAPSVIMWSIGNEIGEGTSAGDMSNYTAQQANLITWTKALDETRPVTRGDNQLKGGSQSAQRLMDSLHHEGGIVGLNYVRSDKDTTYDAIHRAHPDWALYGSETASAVNSRGIYDRITGGKPEDKRLTSYDYSAVNWGAVASHAWYDVVTRDYLAGEFVWTGFDYIGEPTNWNGLGPWRQSESGDWATSPKSSYFGIVDTAGFPKDTYYFYQSQWNDDVTTLHMLPAWNEDVVYQVSGTKNVPVVVYSDAPSVKLFFTPTGGVKKEIGEKKFVEKTTKAGYTYKVVDGKESHESLYMKWDVPYADGTLEAVAYDAAGKQIDKTVGRSKVQTAGKAAKLKLNVDRNKINADGADLAYVDVTITDANGVPVPNAENEVAFKVTGGGVFMGSDNGSQTDHTKYNSATRRAFSGKALGIVKSTNAAGSFTVTVTADGMDPQSVTVQTTGGNDSSLGSGVHHYAYPRNIYVKTGSEPVLPTQIEAYDAAGEASKIDVEWGPITKEQYSKAGTFVVAGRTAKGDKVNISVTMIDGVGAVLNYSGTTRVGAEAYPPDARPVVMPDGTILRTSFPVNWQKEKGTWDEPGIVTFGGASTIFGKEYPVKATIRVQKTNTTIGDNLAAQATLSQSIPTDLQSDTLEAIADGKTAAPPVSGDKNPNVWTNYHYTQTTKTDTADIVFTYATQQRFGEFEVWFYQDNWSARFPRANDTKFFVRDDAGEQWREVAVTETIGEEQDMGSGVKVKPYTYKLDEPVGGTFVKLGLRNNPDAQAAQPDKIKPVTGISEVMLKGITQSVDGPNATAKLTEVKLNGVALPQEALDEGRYVSKDGEVKELTAVAADNAAVTIVGAYKGVAHVIVQSEDHKTTKTLVIVLEGWKPEPEDLPTTPGGPGDEPTKPANPGDKPGQPGNEVGQPGNEERLTNPDAGSEDKVTGKSTLNATAPGVVSGKLSRTGAESVTLILFAVFAVLAGTVVVRWSARRE
ncbi:glycoside hydrolase family 2 TIM barrel-domain containing protein [Trueperella pyogenes]|uniref:DUF4982 domain-containing protein n=1 Tax=Trueperella pyogenes TaxID=1661 RepID=A0A3S9QN77_9ACTO|nr:glycoside hydrolase family 2 TIM barrel-domain containing protein [Trueperella pyogenes]AWG03326.1 beta-galactosidase [Trueperella pyogenes]AWG16057.1 beta-galactosidase [Trueperella pyogenes]AZR04940.1 DUF4982 domain-containing protein [Trueperella pyogenes]AZR07418.1 DUF4982 domain-containing protein [Trueperella pyogenes]